MLSAPLARTLFITDLAVGRAFDETICWPSSRPLESVCGCLETAGGHTESSNYNRSSCHASRKTIVTSSLPPHAVQSFAPKASKSLGTRACSATVTSEPRCDMLRTRRPSPAVEQEAGLLHHGAPIILAINNMAVCLVNDCLSARRLCPSIETVRETISMDCQMHRIQPDGRLAGKRMLHEANTTNTTTTTTTTTTAPSCTHARALCKLLLASICRPERLFP
ncbi:uncharacterized protein EI97DRAFT_10098 [Westerdykella ornata]|uniref:Uncharacterized protein n=1 Tax=Westerdykella ornata TaxID=318751 RepID=A0A6A6JXQ6_WESOR|nr:uncharacterized protein EI97DRAFT_10098 [Westerdykella ornata]KAF2280853.1 hypothetical protein EI97DRAFT_10098 [Westerdykella ornata]